MTTGLNYGTADYDPKLYEKQALESNPLYERVKDLESRLAETEAQAAIKHNALERLVAIYEGEHDPEAVGDTRPAWLQSALSTDAGRSILDELERLRRENETMREIALFLFERLDDIDTLDDAAKGDDHAFRVQARRLQRRRFEVADTDGYTVTFKIDRLQAVRKEDDSGATP